MDRKLKEYLKKQKEELNELYKCEHDQDTNRERFYPYQRDYARILYSNSFRRLQGKMQLMKIDSQVFYRNRLTHSFEVAQIARSIAEFLSNEYRPQEEQKEELYDPNSMYVIEAGALAHDIGNPPFGHHGERVLNTLSDKIPFEGNAQGIRVLRTVEKKNPVHKGLNVSYRTLASIIKYNVPYSKENGTKKFLYEEDFEELNSVFENYTLRTLDVQIIDLADEIAYCSHDLEDSLASNYFTIEDFMHGLSLNLKDKELFSKFDRWVNKAKEKADKTDNRDDFSYYFRRELLSTIVNELIKDINLVKISKEYRKITGTEQDKELGFVKLNKLVKAIKEVTFKGVTQDNSIMLYEKIGTNVLSGLYDVYTDKKFNKGGMLLPIEYRWDDKNDNIDRKVLDYLSGMMDEYAIKQYELYFGKSKLEKIYQRN